MRRIFQYYPLHLTSYSKWLKVKPKPNFDTDVYFQCQVTTNRSYFRYGYSLAYASYR